MTEFSDFRSSRLSDVGEGGRWGGKAGWQAGCWWWIRAPAFASRHSARSIASPANLSLTIYLLTRQPFIYKAATVIFSNLDTSSVGGLFVIVRSAAVILKGSFI